MTQTLYSNWPDNRKGMLHAVTERQAERFAGWKMYLLKQFFPLTALKYPAVIGTFSWSSSAIKRKWIMRTQAYASGGTWVTPGDLARDYLAIKYHDRRVRCTTNQYQTCIRDRRATPIYCEPTELEHGVYVDVVSAYWSIVQAIGWDVTYLPHQILGINSDMSDFPYAHNKMARNCLVSCGLPGGFRFWDGEQLSFQNKPNRFVNLVLWRAVCDVLHGICADLIDAGAVYCYTDGAIVPYSAMRDVDEIFQSWGLRYRVKHEGHCVVRAPADYQFPDFKTNVIHRLKPIAIDRVYREHGSWLRFRICYFATKRVTYE